MFNYLRMVNQIGNSTIEHRKLKTIESTCKNKRILKPGNLAIFSCLEGTVGPSYRPPRDNERKPHCPILGDSDKFFFAYMSSSIVKQMKLEFSGSV